MLLSFLGFWDCSCRQHRWRACLEPVSSELCGLPSAWRGEGAAYSDDACSCGIARGEARTRQGFSPRGSWAPTHRPRNCGNRGTSLDRFFACFPAAPQIVVGRSRSGKAGDTAVKAHRTLAGTLGRRTPNNAGAKRFSQRIPPKLRQRGLDSLDVGRSTSRACPPSCALVLNSLRHILSMPVPHQCAAS